MVVQHGALFLCFSTESSYIIFTQETVMHNNSTGSIAFLTFMAADLAFHTLKDNH